jgi:hypothetical protein
VRVRARDDPHLCQIGTIGRFGGIDRRRSAHALSLVCRLPSQREKEASVHAVVVKVKINDPEAATSHLRERVVPGVSQAPGFVAGYWTRKEDEGLSMVIFDSEDAANQASEQVPSMIPDAVTLENVEVREVAAHA